jgi:hypothetical protein
VQDKKYRQAVTSAGKFIFSNQTCCNPPILTFS